MQLTWRERTVFVWDINTVDNFELVLNETRKMPKNNRIAQGWGLAKISGSKNEILASDGSSDLKIIDLDKWEHISKIGVKYENGTSLKNINELETIPGAKDYVFAHAIRSNGIHLINFRTGMIIKTWECQELLDH